VAVELADVESWAGPMAADRLDAAVGRSAHAGHDPRKKFAAEAPPEIDRNTGEPVVEARADERHRGEVRAPSPRRAERRLRKKAAPSPASRARAVDSSDLMALRRAEWQTAPSERRGGWTDRRRRGMILS